MVMQELVKIFTGPLDDILRKGKLNGSGQLQNLTGNWITKTGIQSTPSNPISTSLDIAWTYPSLPLDIGSTPFVPTTSSSYVNRIDEFMKNKTTLKLLRNS